MTTPKRFHFNVVSSTSDYAKELIEKHKFVVVTANYQTAGRGRNKNIWEGNYGENVYFSMGMKYASLQPIDEVTYLQGLGCLGVKQTLEHIATTTTFCLKYPNDVYAKCLDGIFRKISGVLIEHIFFGDLCEGSIIGIGINVNQYEFPNELRQKATSLKNIGVSTSVDYVVELLEKNLIDLLELPKNQVFQLWKDELDVYNKTIEIIGREGVWRVEGFDNIGRLIAVNRTIGEKIILDNGDSIRYAFE
jgi:BirA family biotin operon repressor/biotin-[acetyl-CoA-carboxylase] ligase